MEIVPAVPEPAGTVAVTVCEYAVPRLLDANAPDAVDQDTGFAVHWANRFHVPPFCLSVFVTAYGCPYTTVCIPDDVDQPAKVYPARVNVLVERLLAVS